jgi:hypothetical protein
MPPAVHHVRLHARHRGCARGRPREGHERRLPQDGRPLLAVQALLQPLPVHPAPPLGHRLPAAHAAREGGPGREGGRDPAGPVAGQPRRGGGHGGPRRPRQQLGERLQALPCGHGEGGRRAPRPQPPEVPSPHVREVVLRPGAAGGGGPPGRPLLHLPRELQRAAGGPRHGLRPREERLPGELPAGTALLRHALPRRRRHEGRHGERPPQRRAAPAARRGGSRRGGAPAHLLVRAQEGVPAAAAYGRGVAGGRPHPGPLRVPGRPAQGGQAGHGLPGPGAR